MCRDHLWHGSLHRSITDRVCGSNLTRKQREGRRDADFKERGREGDRQEELSLEGWKRLQTCCAMYEGLCSLAPCTRAIAQQGAWSVSVGCCCNIFTSVGHSSFGVVCLTVSFGPFMFSAERR